MGDGHTASHNTLVCTAAEGIVAAVADIAVVGNDVEGIVVGSAAVAGAAEDNAVGEVVSSHTFAAAEDTGDGYIVLDIHSARLVQLLAQLVLLVHLVLAQVLV